MRELMSIEKYHKYTFSYKRDEYKKEIYNIHIHLEDLVSTVSTDNMQVLSLYQSIKYIFQSGNTQKW